MNAEEKQALIEFLKFLVAGSAGQHKQIYEIALASLESKPAGYTVVTGAGNTLFRKHKPRKRVTNEAAIPVYTAPPAAAVLLPDEIVGWVREEDSDSRDPLFLCGTVKPISDGKVYNSKYFPVKRLNGMEVSDGE